jgi:hypothetical protein
MALAATPKRNVIRPVGAHDQDVAPRDPAPKLEQRHG